MADKDHLRHQPVGNPNTPGLGRLTYPIEVTNAAGQVERVVGTSESIDAKGDRTLTSEDGRTFLRVHPSLQYVEVVADEDTGE